MPSYNYDQHLDTHDEETYEYRTVPIKVVTCMECEHDWIIKYGDSWTFRTKEKWDQAVAEHFLTVHGLVEN